MWPNPQETANLVTFSAEILNGKLNLCVVFTQEVPLRANMVAAPPPPPILRGDLKVLDQNNWEGPEQKIKLGGS